MMTVRELRRTLAELPPDSAVGLLTLSRVGICVDEVATTCATVQPSIDDDGTAAVRVADRRRTSGGRRAGDRELAVLVWRARGVDPQRRVGRRRPPRPLPTQQRPPSDSRPRLGASLARVTVRTESPDFDG